VTGAEEVFAMLAQPSTPRARHRSALLGFLGGALLSLAIGVPALAGSPSATAGTNAGGDLVQPSAMGAGINAHPMPRLLLRSGVRHGIDVSHWQGRIHWPRVEAAGIDFVIAKATQGRTMVDPWYTRNHIRARAAGIRFTAYHYATPKRRPFDAIRQADHFLAVAKLKPTDLVPALDLEQTGGLTPKQLKNWTLAWLGRVKSRLGVRPMVYTGPSFWYTALGNTKAIAAAGYKVLWIAHYDTPRPSVPAHRWAGNGWTFWQWTECGHVKGVWGCVDRDAMIGGRLSDLTIRKQRRR